MGRMSLSDAIGHIVGICVAGGWLLMHIVHVFVVKPLLDELRWRLK